MSDDVQAPATEPVQPEPAPVEPAPVEPVAEAPADVTFTPDKSISVIVNGRVYPLAAGAATTVPVAVKEVFDGWRADQ